MPLYIMACHTRSRIIVTASRRKSPTQSRWTPDWLPDNKTLSTIQLGVYRRRAIDQGSRPQASTPKSKQRLSIASRNRFARQRILYCVRSEAYFVDLRRKPGQLDAFARLNSIISPRNSQASQTALDWRGIRRRSVIDHKIHFHILHRSRTTLLTLHLRTIRPYQIRHHYRLRRFRLRHSRAAHGRRAPAVHRDKNYRDRANSYITQRLHTVCQSPGKVPLRPEREALHTPNIGK